MKVSLVILVFSLLALCATLSLAREDEDRREPAYRRDPEREYSQCRERCQENEEGKRQQQFCQSRCEQKRIEREREVGREEMVDKSDKREEEEEEEEFGGKSGRPYVFQDQHFSTGYKGKEGRVRVLEQFNKRSNLFKRIENYRVMIFESNPQTFVVPNHWDADLVIFVAQGKGTISLVYTDRRESFNIERGHVFVVPAGVSAYLINGGNNEKLVIVKLIHPVSVPGKFEQFFGAGGENPESFFSAFSNDILEAAFKTSADNLKKVFSQQSEGAIIKASEEQIKALTHSKSSHWPFGGGKESAPIQLLNQRPKASNQYGSLYKIDSDDYTQLRDLNLAVSFANFTQGSMHAPFYNSRVTNIAVVVRGRGYFEMACPHVSESGHKRHHNRGGKSGRGEESSSPVHYEKINSELRQGTVFVVPAGHPFVTVASEEENLEVVCFEINAENNRQFPLAGQKNVYKNIEKEAKELAFATSADKVDEVLNNQDEEFFFRGPQQQEQERRRFYSII